VQHFRNRRNLALSLYWRGDYIYLSLVIRNRGAPGGNFLKL